MDENALSDGLPDEPGRKASDEGRAPTIKTIAANLGLTANTVSRALRGLDKIRPETLALVKAEARRVGYVPNSAARALVLGDANTLGLVITNPSNPFYSELISAVERRSRHLDYTLNLMVTEENPENEERAVDAMLRWRVNGAIVVPTQVSNEPWQRLMAGGVPLVCVNRPLLDNSSDLIGMDYEQGGYDIASHMIASGYWPLRVIEEDLDVTTVAARIQGVRRAVEEHGGVLDDADIISVESPRDDNSTLPWEAESAYALAREDMKDYPVGTGIVAGNDSLALGVYRAAADNGLSIPSDLGVSGQGDYSFSAFLSPGLTTMHGPTNEIGVAAVDRIIERIRTKGNAPLPASEYVLPVQLKLRASTARAQGPARS